MNNQISVSEQQIELLIKEQDNIDYVTVTGDGKHFELTIVSDVFIGLSKLKRQLWVYALLNQSIVSGQLHAIHMNTWTKSEWEKQCG